MADHLTKYRQMIFLSGPRQVGKTTLATGSATAYVSWDKDKDRQTILSGADALAAKFGVASRRVGEMPIVAFDEIHRYSKWKTFLKGFFDTYEKNCRIIATGSARMDVYKRGGEDISLIASILFPWLSCFRRKFPGRRLSVRRFHWRMTTGTH